MKNIYILLGITALLMTGCKEGFLDKNPDMRATIDSKRKVQLLLVSAYTEANAGAIMEFSSDNVIDNNSPDKYGHCNNLQPLDKMYNEIFGWLPVVSSSSQDSPTYIWNACYTAIAAANQALDAITELEKQGLNMNAEKGEALLIRAYHHFLLSMVFCQAYQTDELSNKPESGLVYMTSPETQVKPQYTRLTLTETYKMIEKDLEAGLAWVSDDYYTVPKFHFNIKAAHAFAARFYLYYRQWDKVIQHANVVLGTDYTTTRSMLFDHAANKLTTDVQSDFNGWTDAKSNSNLLLYTTMSQAPYTIFESYGRYQLNREARDYTMDCAGPCWDQDKLGRAFHSWSTSSGNYGSMMGKFYYLFEYTDKVNGYGMIHGMTRAFTSDETLLCRAEAKVHTNDYDGAVEDLRTWCECYNVEKSVMYMKADSSVDLTANRIKFFYGQQQLGTPYTPELHTSELTDGAWVLDAKQIPFIHCCLHFRRIETLHDGLRWQDIKRYGIVIQHAQGIDPVKTLEVLDERRAIQLPVEVVAAGMTPNPRKDQQPASSSASVLPSKDDSRISSMPSVAGGALTIVK